MRVERIFTTPAAPDAARVQITSYMEQVGYRVAGSGPVLRFQRGSEQRPITGSPLQSVPARAAVEVRTGQDEKTWVCTIVTVDLGTFANKDPGFWQQEMDGLITALGGEEVHMGMAAAQSLTPAFIIHQPGVVDSGAQVDRRARSGANWFFWIAGLSLVNTIIYRLGLKLTFLIGLAGTVFIEGVAVGMTRVWPDSATLVLVLAFVAEVLVTSIFVLLGALARKGLKWAFIVGLVFYALDGIIWLAFGDYLPAAFHLVGLFGIFSGLRALYQRSQR